MTTHERQILSITCDNASSNDTMTDHLEDLIEAFPGQANRTRCFAHIINLVAKSLIKQFDVTKKKGDQTSDDFNDELLRLMQGADLEDLQTRLRENDGDLEDDNVEGWVDEVAAMDDDERVELLEAIKPVQMVLAKVRFSRRFNTQLFRVLTRHISSEDSRSKSSTRRRFCFLNGTVWSRKRWKPKNSCLAMCRHVGTRRSTCCLLPSTTALPLTR